MSFIGNERFHSYAVVWTKMEPSPKAAHNKAAKANQMLIMIQRKEW